MHLHGRRGLIGKTVIVEEDQFQGEVLYNALHAMKVGTVRLYNDIESARQCLERLPIDCLIMDWFRGKNQGLLLANLIRSGVTAQNRDLPIVLCTGRTLLKDIYAARDAGISEIVVKPLIPEQLLLKLKAACHFPRKFILSETYAGPDRRRRNLPFDGPDRRRGNIQAKPQTLPGMRG